MPWYDGPTLMGYLETVPLDEDRLQGVPFRMPVQWINRPDLDFRGVAGTIGQCLVLNVPGSPKGAVESLEAVVDVLGHALELLAGRQPH